MFLKTPFSLAGFERIDPESLKICSYKFRRVKLIKTVVYFFSGLESDKFKPIPKPKPSTKSA